MPTVALRSLLLAGIAAVSTHEPVRPAAKAALNAVKLHLALTVWIVASAAVGALAWAFGAAAEVVAQASALAMAPALAGLVLAPLLERAAAALAFVAIWLLAATGLTASGGGAMSPLATLFALAPLWPLAIGRPWSVRVGAVSLLLYAAAAALALWEPRPTALLGGFQIGRAHV